MDAVIVSLANVAQMELLYPKLVESFPQVSGYRLGRRTAGGPVHIAEARLKRLHPEFLLHAAVLLIITPTELSLDVIDTALSIVARLHDPALARVEMLSLAEASMHTLVGSAGR